MRSDDTPDVGAAGGIGMVFLDFECFHQRYLIEAPDSPLLVRYVLDAEPELSRSLFDAVDRMYPNEAWSSPGNSMVRRICAWVLEPSAFPELVSKAAGPELFDQLQRVRDVMASVYEARSFERHIYGDVLDAMRPYPLCQ